MDSVRNVYLRHTGVARTGCFAELRHKLALGRVLHNARITVAIGDEEVAASGDCHVGWLAEVLIVIARFHAHAKC